MLLQINDPNLFSFRLYCDFCTLKPTRYNIIYCAKANFTWEFAQWQVAIDVIKSFKIQPLG